MFSKRNINKKDNFTKTRRRVKFFEVNKKAGANACQKSSTTILRTTNDVPTFLCTLLLNIAFCFVIKCKTVVDIISNSLDYVKVSKESRVSGECCWVRKATTAY